MTKTAVPKTSPPAYFLLQRNINIALRQLELVIGVSNVNANCLTELSAYKLWSKMMADISLNSAEIQQSPLAGFGAFYTNLRLWVSHRVGRRRNYLQAMRELSLCSDRDLADIGITRCDIRRIALEAAELTPRPRR